MEKKQIHFFGCSYTAGHELPDSYTFPWLNECKSAEDYYKRFTELYSTDFDMDEYKIECKKLAYPAILSSLDNRYNCINHAEFGSSVKCEMHKAINLIEKNNTNIDLLVFQIPYFTRELILTNEDKLENHLRGELITQNSHDYSLTRYAESKLVTHSPRHWGFHTQLELLLFDGYLKSKNIPSIFLNMDYFNEEYESTLLEVSVEALRLLDHIEAQRTIGFHFNCDTHVNIVNYIKNLVDAKLFP